MKLFITIIVSVILWMKVCLSSSIPQTSSMDVDISKETLKKPLEDSNNVLSNNDLSHKMEQHKRDELFKFALNLLENSAQDLLKQSESEFSNILKDIEKVDSSIFVEHKNMLQNYLNQLKTYQENIQNSLMENIKIFTQFGAVLDNLIKEQDPEFLLFLKDHDFEKFYKNTENSLIVYYKEFSEKFEDFVKSLNVFEKRNEVKLLEWYEAFSKETDTLKKLHKFTQFFVVFLEK
ncbi:uncharacterized protein ACRADG_005793 [Cochliomyia hominivorax]